MVDIIRVDHFRGFEAFWQIPAGEETAINGEWVKAAGEKLFSEVKRVLGTLPILAEDLGVITDEVNELRDNFEFPGMRICSLPLMPQKVTVVLILKISFCPIIILLIPLYTREHTIIPQ